MKSRHDQELTNTVRANLGSLIIKLSLCKDAPPPPSNPSTLSFPCGHEGIAYINNNNNNNNKQQSLLTYDQFTFHYHRLKSKFSGHTLG